MAEAEAPRLFLDADVLVAGSASTTGASHFLLRLAELGVIDAVSSEQAKAEAQRNLAAKLPAALPMFRALADAACRWVDDPPSERLEEVEDEADPKDVPILAAAVDAGCEALVTFNTRDYRPSGRGIRIEKPGEFLSRLRARLGELAEEGEG